MSIKSYKLCPIENIKITKLCRTSDVCATGTIKNAGEDFYFCGSKMTLGSDVILENNHYYVDLVFTQTSKDFLKYIKNLDSSFIKQISDKSDKWYNRDDVSQLQIEHEYIPSIKSISSRKTMKLKMSSDILEFYDEEDLGLPWQLIKKGLTAIPLFRLITIKKNNATINPMWELVQLKVEMPEFMFDKCQIVTSDSDNDDETECLGDDDNENVYEEVDLI